MTHLPRYSPARDPPLPREPGLLHVWYSEVVKAGRPWLFKAIITTTAASLTSSTLHSPKCDWWECPAWPSTVSWHTAEGKDSCERNRGEEGGRGFELYRCHCKSAGAEFTLTQYIRAKSSPLTTWRGASQGYNDSGMLGRGQHTSAKQTEVLRNYNGQETVIIMESSHRV